MRVPASFVSRFVSTRRRGFALLAVLWAMVGIAALALAAQIAARDALAAASYRATSMAARWRAEGCAARARAAIDAALGRRGADDAVAGAWTALDSVVAANDVSRDSQCDVTLTPTGMALDVNEADAETLRRLLRALGADARAEAVADAILDWRDADDVPRPLGAERDWYRAHLLFPPRDGPLADLTELRRMRGLLGSPGIAPAAPDGLVEGFVEALAGALTVEQGRVVLGRAPAAVLLALPGMTEESVARVLEMRARGERAIDPGRLGTLLSPAARDSLLAHYPELSRAVTPEPDAWILVARAAGQAGGQLLLHGAGVEMRLVRAGSRAAIVRRRTW